MRARAGFVLTIAVLVLLARPAASASPTIEPHWYIAPEVGLMKFDDHIARLIGLSDPDVTVKNGTHGGLRAGRVWSFGIGLEVAGGYSPAKFKDPTSNTEDDGSFMYGSGNLIYSPQIARVGGPFLSAGFGGARLTAKGDTGKDLIAGGKGKKSGSNANMDHGVLDLAAGWWFRLSDKVGLRLEARNLLWTPRKNPQSAQLNYEMIGVALQFNFGGRPKDTDGDGVPDRKDKCPDTRPGCTVDAAGCQHDQDGDGVCDGLDKCPGTPSGATVDAAGCPKDSDGDGVLDGVDKCLDTPRGATVDATGCPKDSDGDGVLDGLDKCPDTPKGATVDATGCPRDSDGDGVLDGLDTCPDTPAGAKVDKDGCPIEIMEKETELLDTGMIRLENVNFESAKSDILPESFPVLDVVGQVLSKWPELRLEIGGHTDARGSARLNQKLSEARAQAVLDYLLKKFPALKAEQFTVKGYGKTRPIAPNNTDLGRAKNRRVEFVVINKDVLKKEIERRRLLQQNEGAPVTPQPAPADTTKK